MKAKFLILFFCISVTITATAQQSNSVRYFVDYNENSVDKRRAQYEVVVYKINSTDMLWQREMYFARETKASLNSKGMCKDSMGFIKHGQYLFYDKQGKKYMQQNFENGKRNGERIIWFDDSRIASNFHFENDVMADTNLSWYKNGKICDSFMLDKKGKGFGLGYYDDGTLRYAGNFENGIKNGEWLYYFQGEGEKKSMAIFFKDDKVITINCFERNGATRQEDCVHEKEAEFPGGESTWVKYLQESLQSVRSDKYLAAGSRYQVIIKFIVDAEGNVTSAEVEEPAIEKLDKIALKIITKSPKWNPAIQYSQRINAYRRQPITFAVD